MTVPSSGLSPGAQISWTGQSATSSSTAGTRAKRSPPQPSGDTAPSSSSPSGSASAGSPGVERMRPRRRASAAPLVNERQKAAWSSRRSGTGRPERFRLGGASSFGLGQDLFQLGHMLVPLDQGGDAPEAADDTAVELPDRRDDGPVVGVEEVGPVVAVAGQVDLPHAPRRDRVEIL